MKYEPLLNHNSLLAFLRQEYGIEATELTFVPVGMVSCSYIVTCDNEHERYYLKLLGPSRLARLNASRLNFYLPICEQLVHLGYQVPKAVPTRAGLRIGQYEDQTSVLFPFIEGQVVQSMPHRPKNLTGRLGQFVARMHSDTLRLGLTRENCQYFETWKPHWMSTLRGAFNEITTLPADLRSGQKRLVNFLVSHQDQIEHLLTRLDQLGKKAQAYSSPFVLVHTDINDSNLIWSGTKDSGEDKLWVLDWEGAMIAPAEHDLFIFTGDTFEEFLEAYGKHYSLDHLHSETFGYYFYRRNLEDLTDWIVTIMHENDLDSQDEEDLDGIQRDCVDGWPWLETGIERVEAQLCRVRNKIGRQ